MKDNPCYYDCSCSYFSILFPCVWSIAVCLLMGWAPMLYRVIGCLAFLLTGALSLWNPYGFILTENTVTLTAAKRTVCVIPWEEVQWRIELSRGAHLFLTDTNGKEHDLGNRLWMIRAFFLCCPNPPTENRFPSLAVLKQRKLTKKYILSPCQFEAYCAAHTVMVLTTGVMLSVTFLLPNLYDNPDIPDFLFLLWLLSLVFAAVSMFTAGWITDRIEHSVAAALYQKKQK